MMAHMTQLATQSLHVRMKVTIKNRAKLNGLQCIWKHTAK